MSAQEDQAAAEILILMNAASTLVDMSRANFASPSTPPPVTNQPNSVNTTRQHPAPAATITAPPIRRAKRNQGGAQGFENALRNLNFYNDLRAINGVWSPAKAPLPLMPRQNGDCRCANCGSTHNKNDNVKNHFLKCVNDHGNPNRRCWNDDLKQRPGSDPFVERALLRRQRCEFLNREDRDELKRLSTLKIRYYQQEVQRLAALVPGQGPSGHENSEDEEDEEEVEEDEEEVEEVEDEEMEYEEVEDGSEEDEMDVD